MIDVGPHHHGFLHDTDACVVTSTDEAHQSTPDGAYESAHRTRMSRRQLQRVAQPDDAHAHLHDSHHGARYGVHEAVNSARRRESDNDVGAHFNAPGCEHSPMDGGDGRTRRHHRRRSFSTSDADDTSSEVRRRHRTKPHTFDGTGSFESFWAQSENFATYNRWNDADKLAHLKKTLTGDAGQVLWDTDAESTDTIEKLMILLRNRYSDVR